MKTIIGVLLMVTNVAMADVPSMSNLEVNLKNILKAKDNSVKLSDVQELAKKQNLDLDLAVENYFTAKKQVSVARAALNPLTTGHALGLSLGLTYTWLPLAVEGVLSIPTKIFNVQKNKYLAQAQSNNVKDFNNNLRNDIAHLYFETLTHKAILETIDLESRILSEQIATWKERNVDQTRLRDLEKFYLRLNIERADIYKVHVEEVAALNLLLNSKKISDLNLAGIEESVTKDFYSNVNLDNSADQIVAKNPKYLSSVSLELAAQKNVKSVQWSIIAPSGLSFGYKKNVEIAKNDKEIAKLRRFAISRGLKSNMYLRKNNVDSSVNVLRNYTAISDLSFEIFNETFGQYELGLLSEDSAVETAYSAIRDFRSRVVAHYLAYSSLDDFNLALNYAINSVAAKNESKVIVVKNQIDNPTRLDAQDFKVVVVKNANNLKVSLLTDFKNDVYEVDYIFNSKRLPNRSSVDNKSDFRASISKMNMPNVVNGIAIITLKNKQEIRVKF